MADPDRDPNYLAPMMRRRLEQVAGELRDELRRVDDPRLAALIETSAGTLERLAGRFRDFGGHGDPLDREITPDHPAAHETPPHGDKLAEAVRAASRADEPPLADEP